jgi:sugar O-acyltransferase (sialic acid O-acetyltransferase NeuD family)
MNNRKKRKEKVFVFGASGHAKVVIDIIDKQNQYDISFLVDDDETLKGKEIYGHKVLGGKHDLLEACKTSPTIKGIVAIGSNATRLKIGDWLGSEGLQLIRAIHPSAQIARGVTVSDGTAIMAHAVVNPDSKIGKHVIINTAAVVEHDCIVGDGVHIAPGATLCGTVTVGSGAFIGAGSTIVPNISIGNNVTVGAGSTVVNDVPDAATVTGAPAKPESSKKCYA